MTKIRVYVCLCCQKKSFSERKRIKFTTLSTTFSNASFPELYKSEHSAQSAEGEAIKTFTFASRFAPKSNRRRKPHARLRLNRMQPVEHTWWIGFVSVGGFVLMFLSFLSFFCVVVSVSNVTLSHRHTHTHAQRRYIAYCFVFAFLCFHLLSHSTEKHCWFISIQM